MRTHKAFITAFALLLLAPLSELRAAPAAQPAKPNIIMILADDVGLGFFESGELFDMSDAPFAEKPATDPATQAKLQAILNQLSPAAGKTGK